MSDAIHKIRESAKLISLPEIYTRLKGQLDDPDCTMVEVALLVQADLEAGVLGEGADAVDPVAWTATDLTLEQCLTVQQTAEQYGAVAESIFYQGELL